MRTYQSRLSLDTEASDLLEDYGALFGRAVRTLYAHRRRHRELAKPEFMRLFDLTSRQYNAVKFTLDAMESSIRELRPGQIADLKHRLDAVIRKIDKGSRPAKIHHLRRRVGSLRFRLNALESDSGARLCFGSRKLFNAQHHLHENGFTSQADWRKAWTAKRSSQFFVLGSKDESSGCQGCVLTHLRDDRFLARLRLKRPRPHAIPATFMANLRRNVTPTTTTCRRCAAGSNRTSPTTIPMSSRTRRRCGRSNRPMRWSRTTRHFPRPGHGVTRATTTTITKNRGRRVPIAATPSLPSS